MATPDHIKPHSGTFERGVDFFAFLDRAQDFKKMPVFRARLSLKRTGGVSKGATAPSPSQKNFQLFQKMVPGDASSATAKICAVHGWIGYLSGQNMGTTISPH